MVYVAFSVSVPIIPEFLYEIRHPNESMAALTTASTTTTTVSPASLQTYISPSGNASEQANTMFDASEYFKISLRIRATCCKHAPCRCVYRLLKSADKHTHSTGSKSGGQQVYYSLKMGTLFSTARFCFVSLTCTK